MCVMLICNVLMNIHWQCIQVNKATSWIDGNFIYGRGEVWANAMRAFVGGRLSMSRDMPAYNTIRLPLDNYPNAQTQSITRPEDLWSRKLGLYMLLCLSLQSSR